MNGENAYQAGVSKLLHEYAQKGLKAPDIFLDEAPQLAQKVFLKLQEKCKKFSVAEPRFAGSFGKKTDVIHPDLDLVVVVNACEPPYDEVLEEFEDILTLHENELKIRRGSIVKKTSFSIQFVFYNGIEVDLLAAANLEPAQVFEKIAKNPDKYYSYSSCLVARQLTFMKSHSSSFLHCVIRLVKFWFKSLSFKDKKVYGGSTIMELIGVAAAEEEEAKFDKLNIIRAFTRALDWICNLKTFKLAFEEVAENRWKRVSPGDLCIKYKENIVPRVVGTEKILMRDFFIIEPANPYNDLLGDKDPLVIERLIKFAKVTRDRMTNLMAGHYTIFNESTKTVEVDIMKLFEPQPTSIVAEFPSGITKDFLIGYTYSPTSDYCDMQVRNEKVFKRLEVQDFVEVMKWNLISVINSVTIGNPGKKTSKPDVKRSIENLVKTSMEVEVATSSKDNHSDYDVTITIPYRIDDGNYAVKCSLRWK